MMKRGITPGFTLLETIIYLALFGILMTGVMVGAYNLLEGGNRNVTSAAIQEEGTFLSRKINWALTGASAVTVSGPIKLTIVRPDIPSQSPLVIEGTGATLTIARAGGTAVVLNNDRFTVSNVSFVIEPATAGRPSSVTARFSVQNKPFIFREYLRQ